ncbi:MAG: dTMP kinase [Desulfohalobiaceae bacterium]|nr:dTMP kinase [Desulfohalobiaceae bacterium]
MLITFEGIEGSGKSTQAELLEGNLRQRGLATLLSKEPGGSALGGDLRRILLNTATTDLTQEAELFLYLADRAQHVAQVVAPALSRGRIVILDRYIDSTLAYQGRGRGVHPEAIPELNRIASRGVYPDLTFVLDVDARTGLERARGRNAANGAQESEGRFEAEALAFHQRVRQEYLHLAEAHPQRIRLVDASGTQEKIQGEILATVDAFLAEGAFETGVSPGDRT